MYSLYKSSKLSKLTLKIKEFQNAPVSFEIGNTVAITDCVNANIVASTWEGVILLKRTLAGKATKANYSV